MRLDLLNAALLALLVTACQHRDSAEFRPPVKALAKVVGLKVGTNQLNLPVVAITRSGLSRVQRPCPEKDSQWLCSVPLEILVKHTGVKGRPVSATSVDVELDDYKSFQNTQLDESLSIPELCDMLTQRWARQQCLGPSLFKDNLRRFTLIQEDSLGKENSLGVIGGQLVPARKLVNRMRLLDDEPSTLCIPEGQGLCVAAMRISHGVLAVWIVSRDDVHSIKRQAAAIGVFLDSAAGRSDNYDELKKALSSAT